MRCEWCDELLEPGALLCPRCQREVKERAAPPAVRQAEPPVEPAPAEAPAPLAEPPPPPAPRRPCVDHPDWEASSTCTRCGRFICGACDTELEFVGHGRCGPCRQRDQTGEYGKIGGWLWLPAIGLALELVALVGMIGVMLFAMTFASPDRFPGGMVLLGAAAAVLVFDAYVATRFYPRKRNAPALMILSYVLGLALALVQLIDNDVQSSLGSTALNVGRCAVWIGYFATSERVKRTFVVD